MLTDDFSWGSFKIIVYKQECTSVATCKLCTVLKVLKLYIHDTYMG